MLSFRTLCVLLAVAVGAVTAKGEFRSKEFQQKDLSNKYTKEAQLKYHQTNKNKDYRAQVPKTAYDVTVDFNETKDKKPNTGGYRPPKNFTTTSERLFRMQKIHNIWQKGQKVLNEAKLKALYHDLKTQDAQEMEFKKIKSQGKDKDGLKEAALRAQLSGIIDRFGLLASFPEHELREEDGLQIERMFKDKKLNKLWDKIESAGLDEKEMNILKEELEHHQVKVDQYYAFVDNLHETREKTPEQENSVDHFLEDEVVKTSSKDYKDSNAGDKEQGGKAKKGKQDAKPAGAADKQVYAEEIRVKHQELKENFDELAEKVRSKLNEREFENEKAIKLWDLAKKADFSKEELDSLRAELHHFEHRMKKLHFYSSELELKENPDEAKSLKGKVKELEQKVEKAHNELRGRIARRSEL